MSRLNPNASAFVPSWGPPAAVATPATVSPPPQPGLISQQADPANSWDDEDEEVPQPPQYVPPPPEEPPKPTESVFTVTDDDLEPEPEQAEDETPEAEIKKMEISEKTDDSREHLNIVFIGHVDAGKSTICGQILIITGQIDDRTLQKYEKEAKDNNRESWIYAYILDTNEEERAKGKTVEVGRAHFETTNKRYTILDTPGHKNYVPNMIGGAAQADVAILVISARKGEFETGFEKGGQTREHARLVKTIGVKHLVIVINKMDDPTVKWSQQRFTECVEKLNPFLKATGYNIKSIMYIPISGMSGANLKTHSTSEVCPWYSGPTLLEYLDSLPPLERKADAPLRIPVVDSFKDRGLTTIMGKVESGTIAVGQTVYLMPGKIPVEVVGINTELSTLQKAKPGENVKITVKGIEESNVGAGYVLCDSNLIPCVTEFEAILLVQELPKEKSLLTAGYEAIIHLHTGVEDCTVTSLIAEVDLKTNQEGKKKPTFVKSNAAVRCRITTAKAVAVEQFSTVPQLGRFTLRDGTRTVAMGKVTAIGATPKKAASGK